MNKEVLASKQEIVNEIASSLKDCGSMTIVAYHGLTVAELTELRRTLAEKGSKMSVYKNSLVGRALEANGTPVLDEYLAGPNAFVFSKEVQDGPAVLRKFARRHDALVIKGGLVGGKAYDGKGMKDFATMPNKEGLLSMFCQCLNAPIGKFAVAVNAIAEKAGGAEEAPAA